ncbi:MAG TPA: LPS export ABC transporter periplasmic protein LptC [Longimicrobiales bacterium]
MRNLLLSMGLAVAALTTAALAACGNAGVEPRAAAQDYPQMPADYILGDITHFLTEDGIRRGVLNADSAYFYSDSARADLKKVHLVLYNETGQEVADLTSKTGQLDQRTNAMIARGNVVLVGKGNGAQRVETQELHYDPNQHRIWSDIASTIYQGGNRTQTNGFSADDQLKNIQMKGVRGTVQANKVTF